VTSRPRDNTDRVALLLPALYDDPVTSIPQRELRNNIADVLRRAEAGEEFTITVAGRPAARLGPAPRQRWVGDAALQRIWEAPAPDADALLADLERFPADLREPGD
jgi:prevent-host-death family protein